MEYLIMNVKLMCIINSVTYEAYFLFKLMINIGFFRFYKAAAPPTYSCSSKVTFI